MNQIQRDTRLSGALSVYSVPAGAELFVSRDNRAILYSGGILTDQLYSANGEVFRQVHHLSCGGSDGVYYFSFEDARDNCRRHDGWRQGNCVLFDGEKIGRKKHTYHGNDDVGMPSVTIDGQDFLLDEEVCARHDLTAKKIISNKQGKIRCWGDNLIFGGEQMWPVSCPTEVPYLPFPTIRQPQYLFQLPHGRYVYASADKHNFSFESFQLYAGTSNNMREIRVNKVERNKNGGSTSIQTDEKTLLVPPLFQKSQCATWGNEKLTYVDPFRFDIIESDGCVTLKRKR